MRLIDADALFEAFNKAAWFDNADRDDVALELVLDAPTIAPPPNVPLTLEELREMNGEPVWVVLYQAETPEAVGWMLVNSELERVAGIHSELGFESYGQGEWLAYRRKPEEEN